jgi:hypothetical protein
MEDAGNRRPNLRGAADSGLRRDGRIRRPRVQVAIHDPQSEIRNLTGLA